MDKQSTYCPKNKITDYRPFYFFKSVTTCLAMVSLLFGGRTT